MKFDTLLKVKRNVSSGLYSYTRLNINDISIVADLLPTDIQIAQWSYETIHSGSFDPIHIKVTDGLFDDIIKSLYMKVGKKIEKHNKNLWRIPVKNGNVFFENIDKLILRSKELNLNIIVIHK